MISSAFLFAGANIFNMSVLLLSILFAVSLILLILKLVITAQIVYVDPENNFEIFHERHEWATPIKIRHNAKKAGRRFVGWSLKPDGSEPYNESRISLKRTIVLYAVWESDPTAVLPVEEAPMVVAPTPVRTVGCPIAERPVGTFVCPYLSQGTKGDLIIIYRTEVKDGILKKDFGECIIDKPHTYDHLENFRGWSLYKGGKIVLGPSGVVDKALEIDLYPVFEGDEPENAEPVTVTVAEPSVTVEEIPLDEPETEPAPQEPIPEPIVEPIVEEPVVEEPAPAVAPVEDAEGGMLYFDAEGNRIAIRFSRSITSNLIQAEDQVKAFYNDLKNHILSYKGVKSRISWKFDGYNRGRDQLFKIKLRGKTICVYCAIDPNLFDPSKYHHEAIDAKLFEEVPMLIKIKSKLGLKKAKEIVDAVMAKFGIEKDEKAQVQDFVSGYQYETTYALIQKGLIKELIPDGVIVDHVVCNEEEKKEEAPKQTASAETADSLMTDENLAEMYQKCLEYINPECDGTAIVTTDVLSKKFENDEIVDLDSLKEKKIIGKKVAYLKVVEKGTLDKALIVKASEFSKVAAKMIVIAGGKLYETDYKPQ